MHEADVGFLKCLICFYKEQLQPEGWTQVGQREERTTFLSFNSYDQSEGERKEEKRQTGEEIK